MNPNYLLKDELVYELAVRGIASEVDVSTLRKLFRMVVAEGIAVQINNLRTANVDELYSPIVSKINVLQSLVPLPELEPACVTQRLLTSLHHLQGRIQHIMALGVLPRDVEQGNYEELEKALNNIERDLRLHHTFDSEYHVRGPVESDVELRGGARGRSKLRSTHR
jgi:hypothetical protein